MSYASVLTRLRCLGACGTALLLYAGKAHGQTCFGTYKDAEEKETAGHLIEASELYMSCATPRCGAFYLNECTTRRGRLDLEIPSIVPIATDKSGTPLPDVRVTLDGESLLMSLDGRSVRLDPGMHELVFRAGDDVSVTKNILIFQGDHNRHVAVSMPDNRSSKAAPTARESPTETSGSSEEALAEPARRFRHRDLAVEKSPQPATNQGIPMVSWVLGGVSAIGAGGFFLLSTWGKRDNESLQQQCAPSCRQSSVDLVKQRYLLADVSLGVGVAALTSAVLVYAISSKNNEPPPERQAYDVDVRPISSGALASFTGSF